eukprot:scaffold149386_cov24-Tisochrysis_lutea.AAC.1
MRHLLACANAYGGKAAGPPHASEWARHGVGGRPDIEQSPSDLFSFGANAAEGEEVRGSAEALTGKSSNPRPTFSLSFG